MARHIELLALGTVVAACSGATAVAVDAGHDAPSDVDSGLLDGQASEAGDGGAPGALSEAAAAFCAPYLDASDTATACGFQNCCSLLFMCQFSNSCGLYNSCVVLTPLDAAPPDAGDPEQWVIEYCTAQFPDGGALSIAGTDCVQAYCGDSGLGR